MLVVQAAPYHALFVREIANCETNSKVFVNYTLTPGKNNAIGYVEVLEDIDQDVQVYETLSVIYTIIVNCN